VHVETVPEQSPLQPAKVEPASGVAVSFTLVPFVKDAEQATPQEIPAGLLVTVPVPAPVLLNESRSGAWSKVAVTALSVSVFTVQVPPVPEHAPPQPANVDPLAGTAVRVTLPPTPNAAEQLEPQSIPAGSLVTVPLPAPALSTESVATLVFL
jgi:hypothetical protein